MANPTSKQIADRVREVIPDAEHGSRLAEEDRNACTAAADEIERLCAEVENTDTMRKAALQLAAKEQAKVEWLREALADFAAMPCETTGLEDLEPGCCRTCRARAALSGDSSQVETRAVPARVFDLTAELRRYFESGTLDPLSDLYLLLKEIEAMRSGPSVQETSDQLAAYKARHTPEYIAGAVQERELIRAGKLAGQPRYEWPPEKATCKHPQVDHGGCLAQTCPDCGTLV